MRILGNFDLLTTTLKGIADRFGVSQRETFGQQVAAGAVVKHTRDFNLTRDAVIAAGLHPETPAYDVQQACATSLETAILVGNKITKRTKLRLALPAAWIQRRTPPSSCASGLENYC